MSIRNTLRKAAGLFVELNEDAVDPDLASALNETAPLTTVAPTPATPKPRVEPKTVEQVVREDPGPNLEDIKVDHEQVQPAVVSAPGGQVNFLEIYRQSNVPASNFTAEQALEMINTLPSDLPLDVKRKTVQVTMATMGKATGVNAENVVTDASRKLAALASYSETLNSKTNEFIALTNSQIASLENQIAEKRRTIDETQRALKSALTSCEAQSGQLDDVLEFFSLDVPPSKYSPSAGQPKPN